MAGNRSSGLQGDASTTGGAIAVGSGASATVTASIIEASTEGAPLLAPAAMGDPAANCYVGMEGTLVSDGTNGCDSGAFELAASPGGPDPVRPPAARPVTATPSFTG
jgi:hypothetical protein